MTITVIQRACPDSRPNLVCGLHIIHGPQSDAVRGRSHAVKGPITAPTPTHAVNTYRMTSRL